LSRRCRSRRVVTGSSGSTRPGRPLRGTSTGSGVALMSDQTEKCPPAGNPRGEEKTAGRRSTHCQSIGSGPLLAVDGQVLTARDWAIWTDGWTHGRAEGIERGRELADAEAA